jgi:hypothetical protein
MPRCEIHNPLLDLYLSFLRFQLLNYYERPRKTPHSNPFMVQWHSADGLILPVQQILPKTRLIWINGD